MEKITLDLKKLELMKIGCRSDENRYVLNGIFIKDFTQNGKNYREYISCDGCIGLYFREKTEKIQIDFKNDFIVYFDKLNIPKQFKKFSTCDIDFEISKNKLINSDFNIILDINEDDKYPEFKKTIIPEKLKKDETQFIINEKYLSIAKKFFKTEFLNYFYSNGKNKPKFLFDINDIDDTIKILAVMEQTANFKYDIEKINKTLHNIKQLEIDETKQKLEKSK